MTTESDESVFAELYRLHTPQVYGLCLRMSGNPSEAQRLMQDVFVRVWEQLHQFAGGDMGAWIGTLARHLVLNDRRTQNRLAQRITFDDEQVALAGHSVVVSQETMLTIDTAVEGLSPACRTVFTMYDVEGYTTSDIAQCLGITQSTVRVHLARARRNISEVLRR